MEKDYVLLSSLLLFLGASSPSFADPENSLNQVNIDNVITSLKSSKIESNECGPVYVKKFGSKFGRDRVYLSYAKNDGCENLSEYFALFYIHNGEGKFIMDGDVFHEKTGIEGKIDGNPDMIIDWQMPFSSMPKFAADYYLLESNLNDVYKWFIDIYAKNNDLELDELINFKPMYTNNSNDIDFYHRILKSF